MNIEIDSDQLAFKIKSMNRKRLLIIAAFFTLFTFIGHSIGTLIPQEPETEFLRQAEEIMDRVQVEMPFGSPRTLGQMAYGGNAFISLYLLVSGLFFILSAKNENFVKNLVLLNSAGLAACAIISALFFFPLPAICTGISAVLGFLAARR